MTYKAKYNRDGPYADHNSDFFHLVVGGQVYFADVLRANCEIMLNASY